MKKVTKPEKQKVENFSSPYAETINRLNSNLRKLFELKMGQIFNPDNCKYNCNINMKALPGSERYDDETGIMITEEIEKRFNYLTPLMEETCPIHCQLI